MIGEDEKQIGVLSLSDALKLGEEKSLDIVEVAPSARPPVCKLIDFKKYLYLKNRKERHSRKKTKRIVLKEIRLRPFIKEHDLNVRVSKTSNFLEEGYRIKIVIRFLGREITKRDFGYKLIDNFIKKLGFEIHFIQNPHFEGRNLIASIEKAK